MAVYSWFALIGDRALTPLIFGLAPALHIARPYLADSLRDGNA